MKNLNDISFEEYENALSEFIEPSFCDYLDSTTDFLGCIDSFLRTGCELYKTYDNLVNGAKREKERLEHAALVNSQLYASRCAADAEKYRRQRMADAEKYKLQRMADAELEDSRNKSRFKYYKNKKRIDARYKPAHTHDCSAPVTLETEVATINDYIDWQSEFNSKFTAQKFPPFIKDVLRECPEGYKLPMTLHLLTLLGGICFSRVRATYLDGQQHAPNLQTIIEGKSGQGKGHFKNVYKTLFQRVISNDMENINSGEGWIVQTMGAEITASQFHNMLANNQGVHCNIFESEISTLNDKLREKRGLTYDHLRKAFDNDVYYRNSQRGKQGAYPIFLNMVATGTPYDCAKFIKGNVVGGNATRIAWALIPDAGKDIPKVLMPEGEELERLHDCIDEWTNKYCYSDKKIADICTIDLEYINSALEIWLDEQHEKSLKEQGTAREQMRLRIAAIAFHFAIVIHMLYKECEPGKNKKKDITNLTIHIANYCIERCMHKFATTINDEDKHIASRESVGSRSKTDEPVSKLEPREEELKKWSRLQKLKKEGKDGMSWQDLANTYGEKYGLECRDDMRNAVLRYRRMVGER